MTEAEWLVSEDPQAMLKYLLRFNPESGTVAGERMGFRTSDRKLRLFACACCRQVWDLLTDPRSRRAVEVAERYADGLASLGELAQADFGADDAVRYDLDDESAAAMVPTFWVAHRSLEGTALESILAHTGPPAAQAALLRDLVGNPFRPVVIQRGLYGTLGPESDGRGGLKIGLEIPIPTWLTPAVLGIARRAHDERDFAALPVLADALDEAGCEEEEILRHLRGWDRCPCLGVPCCGLSGDPDPRWRRAHTCTLCGGSGWILGPFVALHARGCWVLDLVLGKE